MAETVYDLAIIGAGVMGLFTADFARRRGARVLVLDQWRLGDPRAASFSLTRSIRNDYLDPEYARLAFAARQLWLDFQRETGESFLIDCGCLNLAKASVTPDLAATYAEQSYRVLQGLQLKTEAFNRDGLRARFPQFDVDLGRLDVEAGFLHVPPITSALLMRLHAGQVAVEEHTVVNRISRRNGLIAIDTAAGERVAERLVLTAGLGTNELLARIDGCDLRLPLRPDRPSESKYLIPPPAKREMFTPGRLPVFAYLDVGIYGHPMLEGKTPGVKIGYYNPPDVRTQVTSITSVQTFVAECMPELMDARVIDVEGADQCSYDLVADDNFILGAIPGLPGGAVGTGWRGTGYKFAPLIGRTLMELSLEARTVEDISRFAPERFVVSRAG
ncbi:MAG TPA: FAD-dependent oxidoreductase [Candidatus Dormibacteraeota bacterium]|nr:FAD-dependent oxidoreductase [Candidatus Dormibacteraeota bacterium]